MRGVQTAIGSDCGLHISLTQSADRGELMERIARIMTGVWIRRLRVSLFSCCGLYIHYGGKCSVIASG